MSPQTEQFIIQALRYANALTISLLAEINGHIVGNIVFSPVVISNGTKGRYGYQEMMV
jgi:putative acetyltransferase